MSRTAVEAHSTVIAHNRQLTGATREDVRDAARHRAKFRRLARQYLPERDVLLQTTTQQIMRKKRERAEARAAARAAKLPTPVDPPVTIVRPDLVEPVRRAVRKQTAPGGPASGRSTPGGPASGRSTSGGPASGRSSSPARRGLEKLVARARAEEAAERAAPPEESTGSRWARMNHEEPASDSFERLARATAPPPPAPDLPDPLDRFADQLAAARCVPDDDENIWDRYGEAAG